MVEWAWWLGLTVLSVAVVLALAPRRAKPPVALGLVVDRYRVAITVDGRRVAETSCAVGDGDLVRLVPIPGEQCWRYVAMVGDAPVLEWADTGGLVRR
jgi:hypothetical protein